MCSPHSIQKFIGVLLLALFSTKVYATCTNTYTTAFFTVGSSTSLPSLSVASGDYYTYTGSGTASSNLVIGGNVTVDGKLDIANCSVSINGNIIVNACATLTIRDNANFNFSGHSIYVMPGGKLIIKNNVEVSVWQSNAYIAVESNYMHLPNDPDPLPGGILQVTNAQIRSGSGAGWRGISVAGGNGAHVIGTAYDGLVSNSMYFSQNKIPYTSDIYTAQLLMSYVNVMNMTEGIYNYDRFGETGFGHFSDPLAVCSGGGLIQINYSGCMGNSNNVINFYNYTNWQSTGNITYTIGNKLLNDKSFIRNTEFKNIVLPVSSTYRYIYSYHTTGVSVLGCKFQDYPNYPGPTVAAVECNGGTVIIDRACNDPYIAGGTSSCTNIATSEFNDMRMYGVSLNSSEGSSILNSSFSGSYGIRNVAINMNYCANDLVLNNNIKISYTGGTSLSKIVGINMSGCTNFWVEGNTVFTPGKGASYMVGILVNEAGTADNQVYRNTIKSMDYSLQANGLNYTNHHGVSSGLRFLCNDLSYNQYPAATDMLVGPIPTGTSASYGFGISVFQGDGTYPNYIAAGNKFAPSKSTTGGPYHIYNQSLSGINYYWATLAEEPVSISGTVTKSFVMNDNTCPDNTICCGIPTSGNTALPPEDFISYNDYTIRKSNLETQIAATSANTTQYNDLLRRYNRLVDSMVNSFLYAADALKQFKGGNSFVEYRVDTIHSNNNGPLQYDTTILYTDNEIQVKYDSIKLVLDNARYLYDFKLRLAALYSSEGNISNALSTLEAIPGNYTLNAAELADVNNTGALYIIKDLLDKRQSSYNTLSAADVSFLNNMAQDSAGRARYIARAILAIFNSTYLPADVNTIDNAGNKGAIPANNAGSTYIAVSPNPVVNELHIALQGYTGNMSCIIYDITGKSILQNSLNSTGDNTIATAAFSKGIYFVNILEDGTIREVQKIVKD